jgi:hypothetical protein
MNKYKNKWFLLVPVIIVVVVLAIIGFAHLVHPQWVGEQLGNAGYVQKSVGLITDAPHATAELFYTGVEDLAILLVGLAWAKKLWRKEHQKFDEEHGVTHE